ncbi:GPR1/FUN34/yaaH family-domain-containing protein [Colletotrichum godetiae]|uniref:GPR1/FUN34/yaaH family-domain-containing protein n=1 Tax=Colletotrichum godetiae TaxID=1209918 RepID=A0AAJ0ETK4_9PEZI|nr:GPR1/FUN34/yaaH family-domain-containing protein [Colletotrichum godetiae]KAK1673418.1 GPR1/FUN34/yaaH family-domain-containing protein [Colletotrichum godetiae]
MSAETKVDIESIRPPASPKERLANSSPFGYGAFATTLMTLSLSNLGIRNVENQAVFIANLCFLAGLGLLISAQWEMVRGNTFAYTTLIAFAFYYGGYGFLLIPSVGIVDSYGGKTEQYYNAFGFYLAVWSLFNLFFFIAAFATNVANVIVYGGLEISYILNCSANFLFASGHTSAGGLLTKVAGGFGFVAALAGFYVMAGEFCGEVLPFSVPLGDMSRFFQKKKNHRYRR